MIAESLVDDMAPTCQGRLKAVKSSKKQRPRSAGHPYAFDDRKNEVVVDDSLSRTVDGDFMKNFNDVVCQSMYQVINPHAETEMPSSSQMEMDDDLLADPNAMTPPCLLSNPDQTGSSVQLIPTLFSASNQPQAVPNNYNSPPSNDNAPTSTTVDTDKPASKLVDFRVQDLKNECKKRQIPVSGTKPQLLERLKPFEDEILASLPGDDDEFLDDPDSVDSTIARVAHSHEVSGATTQNFGPTTTPTKPCCGGSTCSEQGTIPVYTAKQPSTRDFINSYLEGPHPNMGSGQGCQNGGAQKTQMPKLVLQMPQNSCQQQQVVQLVDATGAVIGVATVMNPQNQVQAQQAQQKGQLTPQTAPCCGCMQAQGQGHGHGHGQAHGQDHGQDHQTSLTPAHGHQNPGSLGNGRRLTLPALETRVDGTSGNQNNGFSTPQPQGPTLNFGQMSGSTSATTNPMHMIPSTNIPSQQSQSTFSFAQLGSGGEFTLIQSTPSGEPSCQGCQSSTCLSSSTKPCSMPAPASVMAPTGGPQVQVSKQVLTTAPGSCQACPGCVQTQPKPQVIVSQRIFEDCCVKRIDHPPSTLVRRKSLPSLIPDQHAAKNLCPRPADDSSKDLKKDPLKSTPKVEDPKDASSDDEEDPEEPIDPSTLFTLETMSLHEEMLRFQHKKIEELQEELRASQAKLRQQQQMILKAKRSQMRQETEEGRVQTPTEAWLKDLDIKQLNKQHIQQFLHLKLQQQQMAGQVAEYQKLATAEQILQEELHIEQAVKDIVRLIKQDARTSLLIVQLLRRYQLERCQQIQLERAQAQGQGQAQVQPLQNHTEMPLQAQDQALQAHSEMPQGQPSQQSIQGQQECDSSQNPCQPCQTVQNQVIIQQAPPCQLTCYQPRMAQNQVLSTQNVSQNMAEDNDVIEIPRKSQEPPTLQEKVNSILEQAEKLVEKEAERPVKVAKKKSSKAKQGFMAKIRHRVLLALMAEWLRVRGYGTEGRGPRQQVAETTPQDSTKSVDKTSKNEPQDKPKPSDSALDKPSSGIDMEEIFKNVLEGASRVLRGEDSIDGKPPSKKKKKTSTSNPSTTDDAKTQEPAQAQEQPKPKPPSKKKTKPKPKPVPEEVVQQQVEQIMVAYAGENLENMCFEEGFPENMSFDMGNEFQEINFNKLPSCSQLLQPSRDLNIETTINFLPNTTQYQLDQEFASINVDCSGKIDYSAVASVASFNNHQLMNSFINEQCQSTVYFNDEQVVDHLENVDIDDLLDVLRDDQENQTRDSIHSDHTLGYTNDELVNFLSVDWTQNSQEPKSQPMSVPPYNFIHSAKSNMSAMDGFSLDSDSHQGSVATVVSSESMSDSTEQDFMQQAMDQFNMPTINNQMLNLPNGNVCLQNNPMFSPMPQQQDNLDNMDWWDPMQNPLMITNDAHSMQLSVNSIQETGFQPMDALV